MTVQKTKTLVGGLLLVLCTVLLPAAFLTAGAAALRPLLALGLALALWLMDALPAPEAPAECLPPALLSLALLFWHAGSSTGQYAWRTLPLLGLLLAALCLVQMARALLLGRWSWRFDSRRAAALFALVLLALLQGFAAQELRAQRIKNEFYGTALVLVLNLCCGALLLPFLRPRRALAPWFAALGLLLLLCFAAANHLPEGLGILRDWLGDIGAQQNLTLGAAFLFAAAASLAAPKRAA